jgi:hypothetical protein
MPGVSIQTVNCNRMNESAFLQKIIAKSGELGINPLLLLAGIEGIYSFRNVPLNEINFSFLDSLILTILALRIGDGFHVLAEQNLSAENYELKLAAINELTEMSESDIAASNDVVLQSFYKMLDGKSPVRRLHIKALEAAAIEISRFQLQWNRSPVSEVMLTICKQHLAADLDLGTIFSQ